MARITWDYIVDEATSDAGMGAAAALRFHYFNKHGLYAKWVEVNARVGDWCDNHPERPNGVLMVHGSLNDHPWRMIQAGMAAIKQRKNVKFQCNYAITVLEREIERAEAFLADETLWPAPKEAA